jgi:hypothetical protein
LQQSFLFSVEMAESYSSEVCGNFTYSCLIRQSPVVVLKQPAWRYSDDQVGTGTLLKLYSFEQILFNLCGSLLEKSTQKSFFLIPIKIPQ